MAADLNIFEYETLDELLRALVGPKNKSGKSVGWWADILGLAESSLYAKGPEAPFTLKQLVTVVASGESAPVKWLAARCPRLYVAELPPAHQVEALAQGMAEAVKEFGEFMAEAAAAIADGRVTSGELARIQKEGSEAVAFIMGFVELAKRLEKSGENHA